MKKIVIIVLNSGRYYKLSGKLYKDNPCMLKEVRHNFREFYPHCRNDGEWQISYCAGGVIWPEYRNPENFLIFVDGHINNKGRNTPCPNIFQVAEWLRD